MFIFTKIITQVYLFNQAGTLLDIDFIVPFCHIQFFVWMNLVDEFN